MTVQREQDKRGKEDEEGNRLGKVRVRDVGELIGDREEGSRGEENERGKREQKE